MLKMLPRRGKTFLLNIFNSSMRISYFPEVWKQAIVVQLLKPKKSGSLPGHYRSISLLFHMSKVILRLIHQHMLTHCREENGIPPEQPGFLKGVSCDHHLVKLQEHTEGQMSMNKATAFISLDCTQAFDSVSHTLLIRRFEEFSFPVSLCRIIRSYLSEDPSSCESGIATRFLAAPPVGYHKGRYWGH